MNAFRSLIFFAALLSPAAHAQTAQEIADRVLPRDDWQLMRIAGSDVGYVRTSMKRLGDDSIEVSVESKLTINRLGSTISIAQSQVSRERLDGSLIAIESMMDMSNQVTKSKFVFDGPEVTITTELMGRERDRTMTCPEGTVGPFQLLVRSIQHGHQPGTEFEVTAFVAELGKATEVYTKIEGKESVTLENGETVEATKTIVETDGIPAKVANWVDANFFPLRAVLTTAGMEIEMLAASEERARKGVEDGHVSNDVFEATVIRAREHVAFTRRADAALLEVKIKDADIAVDLPSTSRQKVSATEAAGTHRVELTRQVPPAGKTGVRPLASVPDDIATSLQPNTMIQCDEPEIQRIAEAVVGEEKDAWRAAQKLERWVFDNLTEKSFDVGFASALEVCRDRAGDCSEHAVLLAALCRAAGIPCNVVMGVLYIGGIWGGHAWNEVWIDGAWYALDATLGFGSVDPYHLAMASLTMADEAGSEEMAKLMGTLGNLEIRVEKSLHDGRWTGLDDVIKVDGRKYTNKLWGIEVVAPEGWELEPTKPRARIEFELLEIEGRNSEGKRTEIDVDALDTPVDFTWDSFIQDVTGAAMNSASIVVDGREGRLIRMTRGDRDRELAIVSTGAALFLFEFDRVGGDADRELFKRFLETVDFDVK